MTFPSSNSGAFMSFNNAPLTCPKSEREGEAKVGVSATYCQVDSKVIDLLADPVHEDGLIRAFEVTLFSISN